MAMLHAVLAALSVVGGVPSLDVVTEINVAAGRWGATASASSVYSSGYEPENVLDGRWSSRETDKWNTRANAVPHWIVVDLGREHIVHRVVIRHEGVYGEGASYNTSDFRVQGSAGPAGPWTDLVRPIVGNRASITTHSFAPRHSQCVRLLISKAEQGANGFARIFEIEVYARRSAIDPPLVAVTTPPRLRRTGDRLEQAVAVESSVTGSTGPAWLRLDGAGRLDLGPADERGVRIGWMPVLTRSVSGTARFAWTTASGADRAADVTCTLDPPYAPVGVTFPSYFQNGTVHIVSSSHQDVAWMDTPERCAEQRDRQVITPALEIMRRDPGFRFVMEDMLALMEYWERHPERRAEVLRRTREGRLEWAATYTQPYEGLESGESLVRQLVYGRGWLRRNLPGCDSVVAWSPDVPGRTAQMPQILSRAGVKYLVLSRQDQGLTRWRSPDGSSVVAYSPGHYVSAWDRLRASVDQAAANVASDLKQWLGAYQAQSLLPAFGYVISTDSSGPSDFGALRSQWPQVEGESAAAADGFAIPRLRNSTSRDFLDAVVGDRSNLRVIEGERPNVWLYIHGPAHHHAIAAKREAARLLPAAESFAVLRCLAEGSPKSYPRSRLDKAWMAQLYPDHGWGGYYGEITDDVFARKLRSARDTARDIAKRSCAGVASRVRTVPGRTPVVVFNGLSWRRTGPVEVVVPGPPSGRSVRIVDAAGRPLPTQAIGAGPAGHVRVAFVAAGVPSLGYKTFYVDSAQRSQAPSLPRAASVVETHDYRIDLAPGGIRGIYDKRLRRGVLRTDKWLGGELFTMQSVGNGAGEFAEVQQPTMEEFDRLSRHAPAWCWVEQGPVRDVLELRVDQKEAKFRHCSVRQRLIVYRTVKRIDLETDLLDWDGTPYREFRLAFPVNAPAGRVAYDAPMGVVEVGKSELAGAAGERYTQTCADVRPREVQDWIHAGDGSFGVTLASDVAVCDYVDPTPGSAPYPVLQPILLASRRSCHGQGNWYLQAGSHSYRFSILSHAGDWRAGRRYGAESNSPMLAVVGGSRVATSRRTLPPELSLCSLNSPNVVVTALKLSEKGRDIALRLCEMDGRDADVRARLTLESVRAVRTDLLEEGGRHLPLAGDAISLRVGHHAIETIRISPRRWRVE